MAAVYRGWDRVHRCDVVVKVQRATDDLVAVNRFEREAAVMLRLHHPSIVTLYAYQAGNSQEGSPAALIMEYVTGQTLAALVAAEGCLAPLRAVQIMEEIAAALDCVHAVGIVHRDIKPANILLPRRGPAKLTDFGVARIDDDAPLTVMGDMLGTIEYASPEQVHGNGAVDARSDVYSLAAAAYFALTGTPPFRAADSSTQAQLSVMHQQVFSPPPPLRLHRPGLSPAIEEAVLRGLAKEPDARYASAGQFAAALRAAVVAASSGAPQQKAMAASSRRNGTLAGALAGAALLAGLVLWKTGEFKPSLPVGPLSAAHAPSAVALPKKAARLVSVKPLLPKAALPKPKFPKPAIAAVPSAPRRLIAAAPTAPKPARKSARLARAFKKRQAQNRSQKLVALLAHPAPTDAPRLMPSAHPLDFSSMFPEMQKHPIATPKPGWLRLYATQNIAGLGRPAKITGVPAQEITVDGKAAPALAAGHWISLPAGRHHVSFYPSTQSGFGPRIGIPITVVPGARTGQQIPLALAAGTAPKAH